MNQSINTIAALLLGLTMYEQVLAQDDAADLARQATDPTASLMSMGLIAGYVGDYHGDAPGLDDYSLDLTFRPAIPFEALGQKHILRMTIPYRASGRGQHGLGAVSIFDIVVLDRSWGKLAVGAVASLAAEGTAADTFAIGPAVGFVRPLSKKLNVGLFNQNVFAGDTAVSLLQPIIAYQLGNGWSLSAGELQFAYDFKESRWLSLPLGFQVGKVSRIGNQPVRYALNPQYNFADDDGLPGWSLIFTFTLLVPGG